MSTYEDEYEKEERKKKRLIKAACFGVCGLAAGLTIGFGSIYHVTEQQQAVVTRFGKVIDTKSAGLYFKIPFADRVHKVTTTTSGIPIGYSINEDTKEEGKSAEAATVAEDSIMITSDFNLLDVDFYLEYKVSDPVKYIYSSNDPEGILKNLTKAAIRSVVSDYTVDSVMTTDKAKVQADIKTALMKSLEKTDIGIQVVNISMQDAEPPTAEIMTAFKSVESAKQDAATAVTNAKKYQSEQLPKAEADADQIVQQAEAKKAARIADAEGQVERFNKTFEQYQSYPLITKKRMFYETMESVLPDLKVIIDDGKTEKLMPLESFSTVEKEAASAETSEEKE